MSMCICLSRIAHYTAAHYDLVRVRVPMLIAHISSRLYVTHNAYMLAVHSRDDYDLYDPRRDRMYNPRRVHRSLHMTYRSRECNRP